MVVSTIDGIKTRWLDSGTAHPFNRDPDGYTIWRKLMGWFATCQNCGNKLSHMNYWWAGEGEKFTGEGWSFTCTPGGCGAWWTPLWSHWPKQVDFKS
jgi:hypothetical protein